MGTRIFADRYRVVAALGQGGMGKVYRAEHLGLGKMVALKILGRDGAARDPSFTARFAREAKAIARLDHPGCVRVLDYGEDGRGQRFIAMELIEGPTLGAALRSGPLSEARALHVARGMLSGLAHAHAHGVIHRDLKPDNVMFAMTSGFRVVLIDFGLASVRDAPALTGAGIAMGSPSYLAPERLHGEPHDVRSDLYAVGVILYEMLAGARPFEGDSPQEIMCNAMSRPARPLRALRPEISPLLDATVRRAMAKDPAQRFQDAEEMLAALADVVAESAGREVVEPARDAAASSTVAMLALERRSTLWRLWSWLRYGAWRWRFG